MRKKHFVLIVSFLISILSLIIIKNVFFNNNKSNEIKSWKTLKTSDECIEYLKKYNIDVILKGEDKDNYLFDDKKNNELHQKYYKASKSDCTFSVDENMFVETG